MTRTKLLYAVACTVLVLSIAGCGPNRADVRRWEAEGNLRQLSHAFWSRDQAVADAANQAYARVIHAMIVSRRINSVSVNYHSAGDPPFGPGTPKLLPALRVQAGLRKIGLLNVAPVPEIMAARRKIGIPDTASNVNGLRLEIDVRQNLFFAGGGQVERLPDGNLTMPHPPTASWDTIGMTLCESDRKHNLRPRDHEGLYRAVKQALDVEAVGLPDPQERESMREAIIRASKGEPRGLGKPITPSMRPQTP
ncbi:MAG: hypothetical protein PHU85_04270 [Phycisphaerae bacterium]|nr:hypothetical protein [Phycisphaerae bacterium]